MKSKNTYLSDPVQDLSRCESGESVDALLDSIRKLVSPDDFSDYILDLNRPIISQEVSLSEKTVSESTHVLSSFMNALVHSETSTQEETVSDSFKNKKKEVSGTSLEELVSECLKAPLNQWLNNHQDTISNILRDQINQRVIDLIQQWLNTHLPALIKESVDRHLQLLVNNVQKNG